MRDRIALVDHQGHIPIEILKRIEFGLWITRHQGAHHTIGTGAMSGYVKLPVPVAGIFRIDNRHSMPGRCFVPGDPMTPRASQSELSENEIGAVSELDTLDPFASKPTLRPCRSGEFPHGEISGL